MSEPISNVEATSLGLHSLEDYEPLAGGAAVERILAKAETLRGEIFDRVYQLGGVTTPSVTGVQTVRWHQGAL
jgi:hypothetical protein